MHHQEKVKKGLSDMINTISDIEISDYSTPKNLYSSQYFKSRTNGRVSYFVVLLSNWIIWKFLKQGFFGRYYEGPYKAVIQLFLSPTLH